MAVGCFENIYKKSFDAPKGVSKLFLFYRKLRSYTIKILSYCRAKFFEKQKIAFQKCTWLKKSEFAPHVRRRRSGVAAFLVSNYFLRKYIVSGFNMNSFFVSPDNLSVHSSLNMMISSFSPRFDMQM